MKPVKITPQVPTFVTDPNVDHPQHYGGKDDPFEHIKVAEAKDWGYHLGNATKYLWRSTTRGDVALTIRDLKKAVWYIERLIALKEGKV